MRKKALHAFWAVCVGLVLLASPLPAHAQLRFQSVAVDLGDINSSVPCSREFAFVHEGHESVDLLEPRPSCGCLKPRLERVRYHPGEKGVIVLEINTLGQAAGPHSWQMTVAYKIGDQVREEVLQVKGNVVTEVSVQPATVTLVVDGPLTHELTLTDLRAKPLSITQVECTSAWMTAAAGPLTRDAFGNASSKILLAIADSCPVGRFSESVVIHTDDATYRELKVGVTVVRHGAGCCTATPSEVTLSDAARFVRLTDRQGRPVVIESVTAGNSAVKCTWAAGPENQATIKLLLDAAELPTGGGETEIRVQIASPAREVLAIPVRWGAN